MRYLLDTHTFLWFISADPSLSLKAKTLIEDSGNTLYLSVGSVWEMAIKVSLRRLSAPEPFSQFIETQLLENDIQVLNISYLHASLVATLPFHHRDPFDRLLIAQSLHEEISIIGRDRIFDDYRVSRIW